MLEHDDDEAIEIPQANEMLVRTLKGLGYNLDLKTEDRQLTGS
jgi:hypothetical protein